MRWDALFDDLEAQAGALRAAERAAEVEERVRAEVGALGLVDRLRAAVGQPLRVAVCAHAPVNGVVRSVGTDWLLLDEAPGGEVLLALPAVTHVGGLGRVASAPGQTSVLERRLGLRYMLRAIARDRSAVRLLLRDATTLSGTIDRVGRDFVDLAMHPQGEARRRTEVREVQAVSLAWLVAVRREGSP